MTAARALDQAIRAALAADPALVALIGAGRVHDGPPRNAETPHVTLDRIVSRDVSGTGAPLARHEVTLRALSRAGGKREAEAIAAAIVARLDDAALTLAGHRLVSLAAGETTIGFLKDRETAEARLVVTALTEPL